jgi:hypothetical protein
MEYVESKAVKRQRPLLARASKQLEGSIPVSHLRVDHWGDVRRGAIWCAGGDHSLLYKKRSRTGRLRLPVLGEESGILGSGDTYAGFEKAASIRLRLEDPTRYPAPQVLFELRQCPTGVRGACSGACSIPLISRFETEVMLRKGVACCTVHR